MMHLTLTTLLGVKVDKQIYEIILPTTNGQIAVFPGHEALVTLAAPGVIAIRNNKIDDDSQLEYLAISGGVVEISQTAVKVLVDESAHGEDIVEEETRAALERAMELRDNAKDQIELEEAHQLVDRHLVRLKVAELHRHHRHHQ